MTATDRADDAGAALDAIRARAESATDGPWWAGDWHVWAGSAEVCAMNGWTHMNDADFIAHAREDVPRLLAAVDAVLGLCDRYEHADERFNPPTGQQVAAKVHNAITEALTRKEEARP